jgi:hypothetical protein
MSEDTDWYWCLDHKAAERADGCPPDRRLGPYPSREAAEHWKERVEARNEAWDADDEEWSGERP